MTSLSESDFGKDWLSQFPDKDQSAATLLINSLMLVSASAFAMGVNRLLASILKECRSLNKPMALYAEREMEKENGEVGAFFPNSQLGRATGKGLPPIVTHANKQEVGSEGITATLITSFCRLNKTMALSHSGPDELRSKKVGTIVIVTDFVGSGNRICTMLDAFEKVATLQSWMSYHLIEFRIVAFSGTEYGLWQVRNHPLKPKISTLHACPTFDEAFGGLELASIQDLCKRYPRKSSWPFGYGETGALIAFSHGIPNNAPSILHSSAKGWKPLFAGRSTLASSLDDYADTEEQLAVTSKKTIGVRGTRELLKSRDSSIWVHTMLVLVAARAGSRTVQKIAARTRLKMFEVEDVLRKTKAAGWTTEKHSITRLGLTELRYMKWHADLSIDVVQKQDEPYYPTQLRER
jgi:hypothetical protein